MVRNYRRRYRVRPRRFVRRKYTRSVPRNRIGKGFDAKRYVKLRQVAAINTLASGFIAETIDDLPNGVGGWSHLLNVFDWYRVAAIKLTFVPSNTAISNASYSACFVWHDPNKVYASAGAFSVDDALGFSTVRIVNMQRKWSVYYKMHRTLAVGNSTTAIKQDGKGYITPDTTVATQSVNVVASGFPTATTKIGDLVIIYYVVFKGQSPDLGCPARFLFVSLAQIQLERTPFWDC